MTGFGVLPLRAGRDQILDRHDEGRVGPEAQPAADPGRPPGKDAHAVTGPGLGDPALGCSHLGFADLLSALLLPDPPEQLADLEVFVPRFKGSQAGRAADLSPVGVDPGHDDGPSIGRAEPSVAAADLEAGGQPLHIPLPRPGKRLVEVVEVEDHLALRRAEQAEVGQVGVTAELHGDPRLRGGGQIGGHDEGGAPVEGEGRHHHPPVANRDQVGYPAGRLLFEQRDRVGSIGRRCPPSMAGSRRLPSGRLAPCDPLRIAQTGPPPC